MSIMVETSIVIISILTIFIIMMMTIIIVVVGVFVIMITMIIILITLIIFIITLVVLSILIIFVIMIITITVFIAIPLHHCSNVVPQGIVTLCSGTHPLLNYDVADLGECRHLAQCLRVVCKADLGQLVLRHVLKTLNPKTLKP